MLLLLLAGIYAVLLPLGFGVWLVRLLRASLGLPDAALPGAFSVWLGGLLLLTVLLEAASLVMPVHTAAHLGAVAVAAAGLWPPAGRQLLTQPLHQWRQWHWLPRALAGLLLLYALYISSMPPLNIDTGIYHAQSVRWLEELGVVPGLVNAELHIGFNSAWFVPEALFSWGRYVGSPLQVLNAVFFVLFGWYCLAGLNRLLQRQARPADMARLALLLLMFQLLSDLSSLSPDPAVALLVFFIVLQALELPPPQPGQPLSLAHVLTGLLCVFATTLKLSTLPVLLLPGWWLLASRGGLPARRLLVLGALGLAIVAPWVARNVVISGYLVFPVALDLLPVRWKLPLSELHLHSEYIRDFARSKLHYVHPHLSGTPLRYWLPIWWHEHATDTQALLLAIPALLLASPPLAWWLHQRGQLPRAASGLVALGLALAGSVFWFAVAPAPRFGYGFLLALLALLLLPWGWVLAGRYARLLAAAVTLALLLLLIVLPLQLHYIYYYVPDKLSQSEYHQLLNSHASTPADRDLLRRTFQPAAHDSVVAVGRRGGLARLQLVLAVARAGGLPGTSRSGLDGTGRSGFFNLAQRLVFPAPYPVIAVQPLQLGALRVLQSQQDNHPWYAPFPFVSRRKLCLANDAQLRDGFCPRPVAGPRNWFEDGRW